MIKLTELDGNIIDIQISDVKLYRGTEYGTYIEMKNGTEFRVKESFESIDLIIDL